MSADYVISPPPQPTIAVAGTSKVFPVRRIWCVGRNYIEHIREMGQDERLPPFYFAKPADAILVVEGGEIVERGRHDDLLRRAGRYASFFRIQHRDAGPLTLAPISATA